MRKVERCTSSRSIGRRRWEP